ncbi:hypothetical protein SARC_08382 [Sphaeroforma arctica JP610]|uniref:Vacuolar protein-sorting-associated protein 25 n=1 Tax=Sphaeroforma arctica JP610 TaxID=667725 RepID=A0A0L0FTB6_9EUKA|nr:hypothetical protein SARC_08382 [Sphaeroforma arctica JP610]KNC79213.1 hypothetical protein SARC_08382 [Sphaeroforma arctica JP610]|eukprot:XP_014153115.1 hypothetical protein SARC_08382 [Sphaeroforma arctica JP610]
MVSANDFEWPDMYNFPPFFTLQRTEKTQERQLEQWSELIKAYYKHTIAYELTITEAAGSELFRNAEINRRASDELIQKIISTLEKSGNAECIDQDRNRFRIYWRSIAAWANTIYSWIEKTSRTDMVLTFYELREGDESEGEEFHGMDLVTFQKALEDLEKVGKCTIFQGDETDGDGVKFYSV